jgi:hypothetical protein
MFSAVTEPETDAGPETATEATHTKTDTDADVADAGDGGDGSDGSDSDTEAATLEAAGPCLPWALGGIGIPAGTVVTASSTSGNEAAAYAIDGVLATAWSATDYTAWLVLQFPSPQAITGIRMAATAAPSSGAPAANETYTLIPEDSSTAAGAATEAVNAAPPYTIEPAIAITPGVYAGITINIDAGTPNTGPASWVIVDEISLLTTACP